MEAENARLLDRLTKQQEINQSLRVENAKLKAKFEDIEQATEHTAYHELAIEELKKELEEKEKEVSLINSEEMENEEKIAKLESEVEKLKEDFAGWKASYDDDIREARAEGIDELEKEIEKLKEKEKEWQHAFRPFGGCLTLLGPSALEAFLKEKTEEIEELKEANKELRKLAMGINIVSRLVEKEEEVEELKAKVEMLKRQQCDTEYELTYYKNYIMIGGQWGQFAEECSGGIKGSDVDINWGWLEDDFNRFSVVYYYADPITGEPIETKTTMIRDKNEILDNYKPTPEELEEHKQFFSDRVLGATIKSMELIKVYDFTEE